MNLVFNHIKNGDNKQLKLESYIVRIDKTTSTEVYEKLFKDIPITAETHPAIIDSLLDNYIKLIVANEFKKFKKIIESEIYKITIVTHLGSNIEMMLSKHDKVKLIMF